MSFALKTLTEIRLKIRNSNDENDSKILNKNDKIKDEEVTNNFNSNLDQKFNDTSKIMKIDKNNHIKENTICLDDKIEKIKLQKKYITIKTNVKTVRISNHSLENCKISLNIDKILNLSELIEFEDKYIDVIVKIIRFFQIDEVEKNLNKNKQIGLSDNKIELKLNRKEYDLLVLDKILEQIFPQYKDHCNISYVV